jgi:hypothetical protein
MDGSLHIAPMALRTGCPLVLPPGKNLMGINKAHGACKSHPVIFLETHMNTEFETKVHEIAAELQGSVERRRWKTSDLKGKT